MLGEKKKKEFKQYDPNWWAIQRMKYGLVIMLIFGVCVGAYELIKMFLK